MIWTRLRIAVPCGFCSATVPSGQPVLQLAVRGHRCQLCGERYFQTSPPDDLAPLPALSAPRPRQPGLGFVAVDELVRAPLDTVVRKAAAVLPFQRDARMRQVGPEREVGEEG